MWRLLFVQTAEQAVSEGAGDTAAPQQTSLFGNPLLLLPVLLVFMYFFIMRPQQVKDKERRQMLSSLAKGDEVVTTGGIIGTVVGITDERVVLRVDEKVTMEFVRGAVAQVLPKEGTKSNK